MINDYLYYNCIGLLRCVLFIQSFMKYKKIVRHIFIHKIAKTSIIVNLTNFSNNCHYPAMNSIGECSPNLSPVESSVQSATDTKHTKKSKDNSEIIRDIKKGIKSLLKNIHPSNTQELNMYLSHLSHGKQFKKVSIDEAIFNTLLQRFSDRPSKIAKYKQYRYKNKTLIAFDDMIHFVYEKTMDESCDILINKYQQEKIETCNPDDKDSPASESNDMYVYKNKQSVNVNSIPNCFTVTKTTQNPIHIHEFEFKVFYNDVKYINTVIYYCDGLALHFEKIKQVNGTISHEIRMVSLQSVLKEKLPSVLQTLSQVIDVIDNCIDTITQN